MKPIKRTILLLPFIFSVNVAFAQTAQQFVAESNLESSTEYGTSVVIMVNACRAAKLGIDAVEFNNAIQKRYSKLNWRPVDFNQYIDSGYEYADNSKKTDCTQIAIQMLDAGQ